MPSWKPFSTQLADDLADVERDALALLDRSGLCPYPKDPVMAQFVIYPAYAFVELDDAGKQFQVTLMGKYKRWRDLYALLEAVLPPREKAQSLTAHKFVRSWLERDGAGCDVATIDEAKQLFSSQVDTFRKALRLLAHGGTDIFAAADTNALTEEPDVTRYRGVLGTDRFVFLLLPTILGELDKLKVTARPEYRSRVDAAIRRIRGWEEQGDLNAGVVVDKSITVRAIAREPDFSSTVSWLDSTNADDRFLASSLEVQRTFPSGCVVVVSSDLNLRNKAAALGLQRAFPPQRSEPQRADG